MESNSQLEDPDINNAEPVDTQPNETTGKSYGLIYELMDMIAAQGGKITHVDIDLEPARETKTIDIVDGYL